MRVLPVVATIVLCACSSTSTTDVPPLGDADPDVADVELDADTGGIAVDALPEVDVGPAPAATVYANTDSELYRMDPTTKAVTKIGGFVGPDGTTKLPDTMTDVAVNALGNVYACSAYKIFELSLPTKEPGNVVAITKTTLGSGVRMYALGFAPAGILGVGEELVAGDANGDLYQIPSTGTPAKVGTFGLVLSGDPGLGKAGELWQLSGDVAFFSNAGAPVGLATVRPCTAAGDPSTCHNGNDVLMEIDVDALKTKSPTANLRKRILGTSGTGFGRLYGVGAWGSEVFAFQRVSSSGGTSTALFLSISLATGKGTVVKDFPDIAAAADGWSGAGVTTAAKIDVPK